MGIHGHPFFFRQTSASDSECIQCWDVHEKVFMRVVFLTVPNVNPPPFPSDLVTGLICGKLFDETVGVLYMVMEHQF